MKDETSQGMPRALTRREFLKGATQATVAVTAATAGMGLMDYTHTADASKGVRYGMVIDLRKCFGCHACSVACKAQFDVPLGRWRSWVVTTERGEYPDVQRSFVPVLCNHCENPPCVSVCPTGATYKKDNGLVMQNEEDCIGCAYCVHACPYKVKFVDPVKKVAQKCDFCIERLEQGLLPSCVNTCNAQARIFGDINDPRSEISQLLNKHPVQTLRPEFGTEPHVFYIGLHQTDYQPSCNLCSLPRQMAHSH
jgi:tetrathionate reductase subunit B